MDGQPPKKFELANNPAIGNAITVPVCLPKKD